MGRGGRVRFIERVTSENLYEKIEAHFETDRIIEERDRCEREMLACLEKQIPNCQKMLNSTHEQHYADTDSSFEEFLLKWGLERGLSPAGAGFSGFSDVFVDPTGCWLYASLRYSVGFSVDDGFSFKSIYWKHILKIDVRTGKSVLIARRIVLDEVSGTREEARKVRAKFASCGKRPLAPLTAWMYWTAR